MGENSVKPTSSIFPSVPLAFYHTSIPVGCDSTPINHLHLCTHSPRYRVFIGHLVDGLFTNIPWRGERWNEYLIMPADNAFQELYGFQNAQSGLSE